MVKPVCSQKLENQRLQRRDKMKVLKIGLDHWQIFKVQIKINQLPITLLQSKEDLFLWMMTSTCQTSTMMIRSQPMSNFLSTIITMASMLVVKTMLQSCRHLSKRAILMENMFLLETENEEERDDRTDLPMILSSHRILLSSKSRDQIQRIKNLILTTTLMKDLLLFPQRRNLNRSQSQT